MGLLKKVAGKVLDYGEDMFQDWTGVDLQDDSGDSNNGWDFSVGDVVGGLGDMMAGFGSSLTGALGGLRDAFSTLSPALSAAGSVAAGSAMADAQRETNVANREMAREQMDFQQRSIREQQAFNSAEAVANRAWQEGMSNTAWQRGVGDMRAAGINPMLAFRSGGASTPGGGAAASSSAAGALGAPHVSPKAVSLQMALQVSRAVAELDQLHAATDRTRAEAEVARAQVPKLGQDVRTGAASEAHLRADARRIEEELRVLLPERHSMLVSEVYLANARSNLTMEQWRHELVKVGLTKAEAELAMLAIPQARNVAAVQDSPWMRNVAPFLPSILQGASSAARLRSLGR